MCTSQSNAYRPAQLPVYLSCGAKIRHIKCRKNARRNFAIWCRPFAPGGNIVGSTVTDLGVCYGVWLRVMAKAAFG